MINRWCRSGIFSTAESIFQPSAEPFFALRQTEAACWYIENCDEME